MVVPAILFTQREPAGPLTKTGNETEVPMNISELIVGCSILARAAPIMFLMATVGFEQIPAGETGSFADLLGHHISQRLAGQPAISLGN